MRHTVFHYLFLPNGMIRKYLLLFIFILTIVSVNAQDSKSAIKIGYLQTLPEEIDGCSGLYTYDSVTLKAGKYILAINMETLGFMRINGRLIQLKQLSGKELPKKGYQYIFKGGNYTIILTTKTVKEFDELSTESGTIEIRDGKNKVVIKIKGEVGC